MKNQPEPVLVRHEMLGIGRLERVEHETGSAIFRFRTPELQTLTEAQWRPLEIKKVKTGTSRQMGAYSRALDEWERWQQFLAKPTKKRKTTTGPDVVAKPVAMAWPEHDGEQVCASNAPHTTLHSIDAASLLSSSSVSCALDTAAHHSVDAEHRSVDAAPSGSCADDAAHHSVNAAPSGSCADDAEHYFVDAAPSGSCADDAEHYFVDAAPSGSCADDAEHHSVDTAPVEFCDFDTTQRYVDAGIDAAALAAGVTTEPDVVVESLWADVQTPEPSLDAGRASSLVHEPAPAMAPATTCNTAYYCVRKYQGAGAVSAECIIASVLDDMTQGSTQISACIDFRDIVLADPRHAACAATLGCVETLLAVLDKSTSVGDPRELLVCACEALSIVTGASTAAALTCTRLGTRVLIELVADTAQDCEVKCSACKVLRNCLVRNEAKMRAALAACNGIEVLSTIIAPLGRDCIANLRNKALDHAAMSLLAIVFSRPTTVAGCMLAAVPQSVNDNLCTSWIKQDVALNETGLTRYACHVLRNASQSLQGAEACDQVFSVNTMCTILTAWATCADEDAVDRVECAVYAAIDAMVQTKTSTSVLEASGGIECLCATLDKFRVRSEETVAHVFSIFDVLLRYCFMSHKYYNQVAECLCKFARTCCSKSATTTLAFDRDSLNQLRFTARDWNALPVGKPRECVNNWTLVACAVQAVDEFEAAYIKEDYSGALSRNLAAVLAAILPVLRRPTRMLVTGTGLVEAMRFLLLQRQQTGYLTAVAVLVRVLRQKARDDRGAVRGSVEEFRQAGGLATLAYVLSVAAVVAHECGRSNDAVTKTNLNTIVTDTVGCLKNCCWASTGCFDIFRSHQGCQALQQVSDFVTEPVLTSWVASRLSSTAASL